MFCRIGVCKSFTRLPAKQLVGISLSAILLKRDSKTGVFLWGLSNFQEYLFRRTPKKIEAAETSGNIWGTFAVGDIQGIKNYDAYSSN